MAGLATVVAALEEGESDGTQRYSDPDDETVAAYSVTDHDAFLH